MIGIVGTIVLLPLALAGLLLGAVRFAGMALYAVAADVFSQAAHRLAFHA